MTAPRLHGTLLFGLACMSVLQGHAQFVTLEGRRFMLDGQEFYPVVLNYGIEFMSGDSGISEPDSIYYSPSNQHGTSVDIFYECNGPGSCDQQLRTELNQVAALGFNTIRLVGPNARAFRTSSGDRPYKMKVSPIDQYASAYHVDLSSDFSDPMSERHFTLIERMLDVADSAGLKVILLTGTEVKTWPETRDTVGYEDIDAANYAAYLHALANHLRDHPALLAYDILNEPAWRYTNPRFMRMTKSRVCELTGQWYDAITDADPNHLVTLGGHSIHEIGAWDPAVMKIDFYSPHLYLEGDWDFAGIYDMDVITDKYMAELYWLGATLEMPWIVGETSFSADTSQTDYGGNQYLDNLPEHQVMPWMHGSEAEQAAFAAETMAATRAYGGSGWSWWYYQNGRSTRYAEVGPGPDDKTHRDLRSNYFGVLSFGHGNDPGRVKPMAAEVQAYQPAPLPEVLPEPPAAYWNWHGLTSNIYRTYHLQDQNQEPVANGVALVRWEYQTIVPPIDVESFWARAVSNSQGDLVIHEPDAAGGFNPSEDAFEIKVDVLGAARIDSGTPWPDEEFLSFDRQILPYARTFSDVEVAWESGSRHAAWAELTIHDGFVHSSGTENDRVVFEARHWVRATGEFHIGFGSEAQLRTAKTFPDCSYPNWGMLPEPDVGPLASKARVAREAADVHLRFKPTVPLLTAYPNPCSDALTIQSTAHGNLVVRDALGRFIYAAILQSDRMALDTRQWEPGSYSLTVNHDEGIATLRLIVAR